MTYRQTRRSLVQICDSTFARDKQAVLDARLCTFVNPYSYLKLRSNADLLARFDTVGVDGISLCVFLKRVCGIDVPRLSFDMTSVGADVLAHANDAGRSIFLVGSKPHEVKAARAIFATRYPDIEFRGTHHGYLTAETKQQLITDIVYRRPDIVICGMGSVSQERFLVELADAGWCGHGYTCGGFLHQTANGRIDYYPRWADAWHLRWLFRIFDEPRLFYRYAVEYPISFMCLAHDALVRSLDRQRVGGN